MTHKVEIDRSKETAAGEDGGLQSFLRRVRRRLLADRFLNFLLSAVLVGLIVIAVAVLLDRLVFPGLFRWELAALILGLSFVVTAWKTFGRGGVSLFHAAVAADSRLGLKERVASACCTHSFEAGGTLPRNRRVLPRNAEDSGSRLASMTDSNREWETLVVQDASRSVEGVAVSEAFPVGPRRRTLWFGLPVVVGVALAFLVPRYDPLGLRAGDEPEDALVKMAMAEEKKKLDEELEELLKKAEEQDAEEAKNLLKLLTEQAAKREKARSGPSDPQKAQGKKGQKNGPQKSALLELARREDVLKKGLGSKKFRALKKALKELQGMQVKSAQYTRALQAALKDGDFAKAKKELAALKKRLAKLSGKKRSELTAKEKELLRKLQEELSRLSRDGGALAQLAPNLSSLASSLGGGDLEQMLANMGKFDMDLDSLAKMSNDLDFLNQALQMIKLSKEDLAKLAQHKCPNCGKKLGKSNKPGGT